MPYAYPAPAAAGAQGSESAAKVEKAVSSQPTAVANGASAASASLPPRVGVTCRGLTAVIVTCWRGRGLIFVCASHRATRLHRLRG